MRGAVPPAAWAFAILVASDMLFLRRFPGSFAPFAFSHSAPVRDLHLLIVVPSLGPIHRLLEMEADRTLADVTGEVLGDELQADG